MKTLTVFLFLAAIAPGFGHLHFSLDLFSHFKFQYLILFAMISMVFAFTGSYAWAAASIAGAILNFVSIANWYGGDGRIDLESRPDSIKVLLSNVSMHNKDASRLLELVDREQPEIVALVEVNQRWIDDLSPLRSSYPHNFEYPSERYRGLALYSRLPLTNPALVDFSKNSIHSIVVDVGEVHHPFQLVLSHPPPPMTGGLAKQRNDHLDGIATYIRNTDDPVVLVGDLNITMWDRTYRSMIANTQLINARSGNGISSTWPAIPFVGVPIDHVLVTEPSQAGAFRVHDSIGSDHFPVSAIVSIRPRYESRMPTAM